MRAKAVGKALGLVSQFAVSELFAINGVDKSDFAAAPGVAREQISGRVVGAWSR